MTEFSTGKVLVTGTTDANKLVDYVYRCTKKHAKIVPQPEPEPEKKEESKDVEKPAEEENKPEEEKPPEKKLIVPIFHIWKMSKTAFFTGILALFLFKGHVAMASSLFFAPELGSRNYNLSVDKTGLLQQSYDASMLAFSLYCRLIMLLLSTSFDWLNRVKILRTNESVYK
ncbi:uncharacterized protein [Glycine max]|uniref:uncharacterized protein n=1 Tax=Glycine max TaxID=3847 RepID=UPI001B355024|nr:uncharacterized protein LOC112998534 [Glycine max]